MATTKKKTSWMTTFFGWLAAVAGIVATVSPDPKTKTIAAAVGAASTGMLGTVARDNKVSSEDAGIK